VTHLSLLPPSTTLLAYLVHPAARTCAVAALAGLGLTVFRVRSASVRLLAWNSVLCVALTMPVLWLSIPRLSIPLPGFLASETTKPVRNKPVSLRNFRSIVDRSGANDLSSSDAIVVRHRSAASLFTGLRLAGTWVATRWSLISSAIYSVVTLLLLARVFVGVFYCRRLILASQSVTEPRLVERLWARANVSGIRSMPDVRESGVLCVPVTMGALRPTILLPSDWREWGDAKLDAVVAHEVSHVARRDALTQRVSLLHRAIFWFSPLAWWLDKHLADLAEQASDEAALVGGIDRKEYAKTLLGFFEALQATPGRVWWQGVSMAKAGQAEQRLEKILAWRGNVAMSLNKPVGLIVIALALPLTYLTASVHLQSDGSSSPRVKVILEKSPQGSATSTKTSNRIVVSNSQDGSKHIYSIESGSPNSVVLTALNQDAEPEQGDKDVRVRYHTRDSEPDYVIVSGNSDSVTMSGSEEDAQHAKELKKTIPGDFIWFRRGEHTYIIRDQVMVGRARKLWAEEEELGKKQAELGEQNEALGKQQEELGERMEKIKVQVPDMTAQLDKLKAELQAMNSNATMEQIGKIQEEIGELQEKIGEAQSRAGEEQGKLGEQMGALGDKQGKIGEQQGKIGERQEAIAREASRKMKSLLDEAVAKGTAQPEK
jgi:beta-lactamase regulating signal transducer with metallopeptidase domain